MALVRSRKVKVVESSGDSSGDGFLAVDSAALNKVAVQRPSSPTPNGSAIWRSAIANSTALTT